MDIVKRGNLSCFKIHKIASKKMRDSSVEERVSRKWGGFYGRKFILAEIFNTIQNS